MSGVELPITLLNSTYFIMQGAFLINPDLSETDYHDNILQKLTQLKSLVNCLLILNSEITNSNQYGIIWTIDSLLDELDTLYEYIFNLCTR